MEKSAQLKGRLSMALLLAPLVAFAQTVPDFRGLKWGDPVETVFAKEQARRSTDWSAKYPRYLVTINNEPATLSYRIEYGRLWGGSYFLPQRPVDLLSTVDLEEGVRSIVSQCQQLRVLLDEKYGKATAASYFEGMSVPVEEKAVPGNFTAWGVRKALTESLDKWRKEPSWSVKWEQPRTDVSLTLMAFYQPDVPGGKNVAKLQCAVSYNPSHALKKDMAAEGERSRREGL